MNPENYIIRGPSCGNIQGRLIISPPGYYKGCNPRVCFWDRSPDLLANIGFENNGITSAEKYF